jgi:hypothetical protein
MLLYYKIIGNILATQWNKDMKRIFQGCELQNTWKISVKTGGLLLLFVGMKGEDRQRRIFCESEKGKWPFRQTGTRVGVGKQGYSEQ